MTVWARGAEAGLLAGPSRCGEASGPQQGSRQAVWAAPTPCLWDRVKVVSALPSPQYPGLLLFKMESLHFPNNQNCEELTHGAGWRLFHSWFFFLLPKSSTPRSRGRSRSYLIPLGLQPFLPQKLPQLDSSGALCGSLQEQGLAQWVAVQSGKGKVAFLSPALYGMAYHSTHE